MAEHVKLLLKLLLGAVFLVLSLAAVGWVWLGNRGKHIDQEIRQAILDAEETARGGDQWGCVWDAEIRARGCGFVAPICKTKIGVFVRHCLERAEPVEDLCLGVPTEDALITSARWASARCAEAEGDDARDRCARIFQTVQAYCIEHEQSGTSPPEPVETSTASSP